MLFIQQYLGNKKQVTKFQDHRRNSYLNGNVLMDDRKKKTKHRNWNYKPTII